MAICFSLFFSRFSFWFRVKFLSLQAVYEKTMIEEPFNEYEIFEEDRNLTLSSDYYTIFMKRYVK